MMDMASPPLRRHQAKESRVALEVYPVAPITTTGSGTASRKHAPHRTHDLSLVLLPSSLGMD